MKNIIENEIKGIVDSILKDYGNVRAIDRMENAFRQLDQDVIIDIIQKLLQIIYPGYYRNKAYRIYHMESTLTVLIEDVIYNLSKQIAIALETIPAYQDDSPEKKQKMAQKISMDFFKQIPKIRAYAETDLQAAYDGDPAAVSKDEIIFSYPGLYAITVNRIAHELYLLKAPLIPRIMSEYAHGRTGIDIHPGATIGKYFFIDHGTGVVVGETTVIGEHVKIYQGVTLGALSTRAGQGLRDKKRHPTLEDYVTVYAGASILGGDTVIGKNAVLGSNVFITASIQPDSRVSIRNQELLVKQGMGENVWHNILDEDDSWYYMI